MFWIAFAKAETLREDGRAFAPILEQFREWVSDGLAVFPLSSIHVMELAKIGNAQKRRLIAKLMIDLSRGWFIAAPSTILLAELRQSVAKFFDLPTGLETVSPFSKQISTAFGRTATEALAAVAPAGVEMLMKLRVLEEYLSTNHLPLTILEQQKTITGERERERRLTAGASKEMQRKLYCAQLIYCVEADIKKVFSDFNIPLERLNDIGPLGCLKIIEGVPSFDVEMALNVERDLHGDRPIADNDEMDIGFLSMAIPYCDIVVTEKLWTSLAVRAGLDCKYSTRVTAQLTKVSQFMGCSNLASSG